MNLTLISALMRTLATAASLVTNDKSAAAVSSALNYAAKLVELGAAGEQKLKELTAEVEGFVAAPETLTEEAFEAWKARSDAAHATIQGA